MQSDSTAREQHAVDPYYSTPEWITIRTYVVQLNQGVCAYCGGQGFQADHVIPRRQGGDDAVSNLVCACARCNKLLGGRQFETFAKKVAWIKKKLASLDRPPSKICDWSAHGQHCTYKRVKGFRFCSKHLPMIRELCKFNSPYRFGKRTHE